MNRKNSLVSVIVPTYNRIALLSETLDSILKQTYTNTEIIIIDNYSTDGTDQYIKTLAESRIKYFRNKNYGIISINRNFGIENATGKYICFCDSDDLWEKEKLYTQCEIMETREDIALCFTNGTIITEKGDIVCRYFEREVPEKITYQTLLTHNYVSTLSVMVRKEILYDVGLFDEEKQIVGIEDMDLWLRIARKYSIHYIPERLFRYRIHGGNEMGTNSLRWARKCITLARYLHNRKTISHADFIRMCSYNITKLLYYLFLPSRPLK